MPRKITEFLSVRSGNFWQKEVGPTHDATAVPGQRTAAANKLQKMTHGRIRTSSLSHNSRRARQSWRSRSPILGSEPKKPGVLNATILVNDRSYRKSAGEISFGAYERAGRRTFDKIYRFSFLIREGGRRFARSVTWAFREHRNDLSPPTLSDVRCIDHQRLSWFHTAETMLSELSLRPTVFYRWQNELFEKRSRRCHWNMLNA